MNNKDDGYIAGVCDKCENNHIGVYSSEYGSPDLYFDFEQYASNDRVALLLYDAVEDELYAEVTENLPNVDILYRLSNVSPAIAQDYEKYAFINSDLDEDFKAWLRKKNVISYPVLTVQYNYGQYELCKILLLN